MIPNATAEVIDFSTRKRQKDDDQAKDILRKLDSGYYYAATLCITDRAGRSVTVPIDRSSDLIRALLPEHA